MKTILIIIGILVVVFYAALTIIQRMMRSMVHTASSLVWELDEIIEINDKEIHEALNPIFNDLSSGLTSTDCYIELNESSADIINPDIEFNLEVSEGQSGQPGLVLSLLTVRRDDLDPEFIYRLMGRMMAALAPTGSKQLIAPILDQFSPYSDELLVAMREGKFEPMEQFFNQPWVKPEDREREALENAIEMARAHWSEFEQAFADPQPDQEFFARIPIKTGEEAEYIWMRLEEINNGKLIGNLASDSRLDPDRKEGDPIETTSDAISDWMIMDNGKITGGYTVNTLPRH